MSATCRRKRGRDFTRPATASVGLDLGPQDTSKKPSWRCRQWRNADWLAGRMELASLVLAGALSMTPVTVRRPLFSVRRARKCRINDVDTFSCPKAGHAIGCLTAYSGHACQGFSVFFCFPCRARPKSLTSRGMQDGVCHPLATAAPTPGTRCSLLVGLRCEEPRPERRRDGQSAVTTSPYRDAGAGW